MTNINLSFYFFLLGMYRYRRCCRSYLPLGRNKLGFVGLYIVLHKTVMSINTETTFQRAVSRVMPPDTQSFNPNSTPDVMIVDDPVSVPPSRVETATDIVNVGNNVGHSLPRLSSSSDDVEIVHPSTSSEKSSAPRMLLFNVQYCDRIIPIEIPDTGTVGKLFCNVKIN